MPQDDVKEQIIQATIRLLSETKNPGKITARQIAGEAGANLAMINYYFGSKDALIHAAVGQLMADRANALSQIRDSHVPPQQKLEEFLVAMSDMTIDFAELTRPTIPYLLLEGEIDLPYFILPMVKACYGDARSETECRMIAYQMVSFLQLAFYRSNDFLKLTGMDIADKRQKNAAIQMMMAIFFGREKR